VRSRTQECNLPAALIGGTLFMKTLIDNLRKRTFSRRYAPHHPDAPILALKDVTVRYESGVGLDDVSFDLMEGERVAVVGPNGAGKSTLFKVIAGVIDPVEGAVEVYGHEPGGHVCISYIPQRSQVDWSFPVTVADVVMMGRISKIGPFRIPSPDDWEEVEEALRLVEMADLSKRQIGELSGGQQQRMFVARSVAQEAELMLMDEPLTGLDVPSRENVMRALNALSAKGVTLMVSMHDLQLAADHYDRIMLLNKSLITFGTPEQVFKREYLAEAYEGRIHFIEGEMDQMVVEDSCCEGERDEMA